ncbi:cytosine deaminase [Paenibacillus swuensis]|uniref:Cytosine deaminase n=1 Tax=Paenibacillus swuensis TaxID=1178515 RepID=A0A172TI39_9BACL|nr:amidohydrolase family protein [Paenibacillus swuensis]ANE46564.1 cytosine deaminase [Paenibacillus swuensis]
MLQLLIRNCVMQGKVMPVDVGVQGGRVEWILPSGQVADAPAERTVHANGQLLLPGFVEPHIHLEKAHLLERMQAEPASLQEAIRITGEMKRQFTKEDMRERSMRVLKRDVVNGVTHLRCHAEIDPVLKLTAVEVILELKEQMADVLDIQIVAFPQEGIFQQPGTAAWMEEALRMGVDAVGGIPYNDRDAEEHLAYVFGLAEKYGKPLDFHVDFSDNPDDRNIVRIADMTIERGLQGRVCAGHVTSLGSVMSSELPAIADRISEAGIHIIALPATDLYLGGRGDMERPRRGLAPVKTLLERGVNVIFGTNNIRNAFTPFGTGDPLDMAWLLAQTAYMGTGQEAEQLIRMATYGAASALGLSDYGLTPGCPADMALYPVRNVREVLLDRPERTQVWKRGKLTAETSKREQIYWDREHIDCVTHTKEVR